MLPIIFELGGQKISIFGIILIASLLIYLFSGWIYLKKELESNKLFDVLFLSIINYIFFSRLIGIFENLQYYLNDLSRIFDYKDNNFSFVGLFIGFIISIIFINKLIIKQHQGKRKILEHIFLIFIISTIPLLLGNLLSGRMLGVEVASGIGFSYKDGISRMPISLFRSIFFIISLIVYLLIRRDKSIRLTNIIAGFFMGFAAFEVVINTFTKDFSPIVFGILNIEQLSAVLIFILGLIIMLGRRFSKIAYDEQEGRGRKTSEELRTNINAVDFSYSFKDMNFSINQSELSIQEKFKIFSNSIKRKFKK